jgi:addiction module RelB/DinJ family antitoxin
MQHIAALTCNDYAVTIALEVTYMEKSTTLNLRVSPTLKHDAEEVLGKLGVPMSTAVDMFLNQVVLVGGLPFSVTLHNAPGSIDVTKMTDAQIHSKIQRGYDDYKAGNVQNAASAFAKFQENHS